MPTPFDKHRAFMNSEYRVRLPQGGCAVIRIDAPLPRELHHYIDGGRTAWGFITAWNPFAQKTSRARNRMAQRELLAVLRRLGATPHTGIGVGTGENAWREPSLFVTGLDFDTLDTLGRRFDQAAIVRGIGFGKAELHRLL